MSKLTHRQRAILALEGKQADYVPTFELEFQLTEEAFGEKFYEGAENNDLSESDRLELCRKNAELYLAIAERYEYSIIKIDHAPSNIFPQRGQELVATMRFIREMAHKKGEDYLLITHGDATLAIPAGDSLYEIIEYLSDAPEKLKEKAEMNIYQRLGHCLYYAEAGFDGFALCSDYAFNANPFFSPTQFAEFVQPYLKRIVAAYRNMGKYVIKHTDGNIMPILDMIVDCAPHAIHSIDPQGGMDIAEVKRLYGSQVALCGNVNCGLIETGTEDEVLASCEYAMKHGKPNGGYIFQVAILPIKECLWTNMNW
ncbi:MAG: uroporphyrinogen decarboxylase family protein [Victivallaceae bacterium]|nr:uroporphyrinogen decarboxylase family protein [Victivallaceae bacterium]